MGGPKYSLPVEGAVKADSGEMTFVRQEGKEKALSKHLLDVGFSG